MEQKTQKHNVNLLAKTLDDLAKQGYYYPSNLTLSDILDLADLCDQTSAKESTPAYQDWKLAQLSVVLDGIRLKPLSLGAIIWLHDFVYPNISSNSDPDAVSDGISLICCTLYAMANSNPDQFPTDWSEIRKVTRSFCRKFSLPPEEIWETAQHILKKKEVANSKAIADYGEILAYLITTFGHDIHYWMWEIPDIAIQSLLDGHSSIERAKNSTEKKTILSPAQSLAIMALRKKVKEIVDRKGVL